MEEKPEAPAESLAEPKRFLRYILPGTAFLVLYLLELWLLRPDLVIDLLSQLGRENSLGVVLGSVVASGAIGFLLSTIHHVIHWQYTTLMDHSEIVQRLAKEGSIRLLDDEKLDRESAWITLTALWHEHLNRDPIRSANPAAEDMTNLMHSLGTNLVGSLIAGGLSLVTAALYSTLSLSPHCIVRFLITIAVIILSVRVMWMGYQKLARLAKGIIDRVFYDSFQDSKAPSQTDLPN